MIIKVCGMRDSDNIRAVSEQVRPDWMGFIFWTGSKRHVATVPGYLPPSPICRVGVFVNPTLEDVLACTCRMGLHLVQLHGKESPDFCLAVKAATGLPLIKAISIGNESDLSETEAFLNRDSFCNVISSAADYFLFDTRCDTVGGSGKQFDWNILMRYKGPLPFLLSGGIGPDDAARVLSFHHPLCIGIDVNSRFETSPGIKDTNTLSQFINTIKTL